MATAMATPMLHSTIGGSDACIRSSRQASAISLRIRRPALGTTTRSGARVAVTSAAARLAFVSEPSPSVSSSFSSPSPSPCFGRGLLHQSSCRDVAHRVDAGANHAPSLSLLPHRSSLRCDSVSSPSASSWSVPTSVGWLRGDPDSAIFGTCRARRRSVQSPTGRGGIARAEALKSTVTASEPEALVVTSPGWQGVKPVPMVLSIGVGLIIRFLLPRPVGVSVRAWHLLAIFMSTITGLVLGPLPVGAWAFLGLTTAVLTKTLSFAAAFSAFTSDVIWLIVFSFFFARGFVKTGLGDRVATYFVKWMGKSTLGLSYGLAIAEGLIAPAMPSTTARAGGVFAPIIKSLSISAGSKPNDPSSKRLGAFLIQSQLQAAGSSSAMYLTAAAQNLLCLKLAAELGVTLSNPWVTWFKAASLPAAVALLTGPLVLYKIFPPESKQTPEAPAIAEEKLRKMGPMTRNECIMVATMLLAVTLWVLGDAIGVASVVSAMLGLCVLLLTGVLNWDDCLGEKSAWDTLAWFAILVGMSGQLNALGLVRFVSDSVGKHLATLNLGWPAAMGILQATYFLIHYLFASQTAHVGALYGAFLAMHLAAGVPAILSALTLAFATNLFGSITHYSSGQSAVYFGAGYVSLPDTFKLGAIMGCWNCLVWIVVGGFWWKFLGLY